MKKAVENLLKHTYKGILSITITAFCIALIGACFFYVNRSHDRLDPLLLIIGAIVYLFLIIKLFKFVISLDRNYQNLFAFILLVCQFVLTFVITQFVSSIPQVDLIHILTEINSLGDSGSILNDTYYSVYPNNRFLLMFLYGISRISPDNTRVVFGLLSSICVCTMSWFTYLTLKLKAGKDKGLLALFICVLSPIFYLYAPYYYTDILMLPFASVLFYLVIKNDREEKQGWVKRILICFLIGFVAIIGYKIRAVAVFILIAYFVYQILSKKFSAFLKNLIPIILSAALTLTMVNTLEGLVFTETDETKEFPMTHWVMMGVNGKSNGYYHQTDYELSFNTANKEERTELNIKEIKSRIKDLGVGGVLKLAASKINTVWGKGDYSYQKYLEISGDYNGAYRYLIEDENIVLNYVLQINKIGILVLSILALLKLWKENKISIIAIAVFGAVLFYLMWEVCPRYGLSFLPWTIILSCYTFEPKFVTVTASKPAKYIKYAVVLITVVSLCVGIFTCMVPLNRTNTIAKDTVKKVKYIPLNSETVVTQSLPLYSEFDELKLKFDLVEPDPTSVYTLELINEDSVTVYSHSFTSDDVKDDSYTSFKPESTLPKGQYLLRLSADSDTGSCIYVSYKEKFDYYPAGELSVNGNKETGDLMFEARNTEKRSLYSVGGYIVMCVSVLYAEYLILFKKEDDKNE